MLLFTQELIVPSSPPLSPAAQAYSDQRLPITLGQRRKFISL